MKGYEILVVGSGPAGAILARRLAEAGREVLVLEKARHPRHKPCGGGLPPRTILLLATLGISPVGWPITSVALDGGWLGRQIYPVAKTLVVDRAVLDRELVEGARRAGARIWEGCAFRGIQHRYDSFFHIETTSGLLQTQFLFACDGVFSPTARSLHLPRPHRGFCLEGIASRKDDLADEDVHRAIFRLTVCRGGYAWAFPREDAFAVGVGIPREKDPGLRKILWEFLATTPELRGQPLLHLQGGMVPDYTSLPTYAKKGAWLVGDAAGLVDPLTGEGIYYAIRSALLAADCFLHGGNDPERCYDAEIRRCLLPELERAKRLATCFRRIPPFFVGALMCLPAFRRRAYSFIEFLSGPSVY